MENQIVEKINLMSVLVNSLAQKLPDPAYQVFLKYQNYFTAFLVFALSFILLKIFKAFVLSRMIAFSKKTATDVDNMIVDVLKGIKFPFYLLISLYFGLKYIPVPEIITKVLAGALIVVVAYEIISAIEKIIDYGLRRYFKRKGALEPETENIDSTLKIIKLFVKILLWMIIGSFILANWGINITSLVAGMGIGGIAIAFALQNILGDIFSSFSIYVDKPFKQGDFIVIGVNSGTVEKIGLKTTRIRSVSGEELIIANQELTKARVQNFTELERRRVVVPLKITYKIKPEVLEKIPIFIKEIIKGISKIEFDRCHFKDIGDTSFDFELVYFVNTSDFKEYMDIRQKINLDIVKMFYKEKIDFAYPTQTVHLEK